MTEIIIKKERHECPPAVAAYIKELKAENARLEEGYQKSIGVIAATDCVECKNEVDKLLCDYGIKDISVLKYILDQYQKVIVNITNGRMSYLTYPAETILSVASDIYNEDLEKAINDAVTDGEYQPVKHGRWIKCCNLMGEYFKCSECGYKAEVPTCMGEPIFTYCPICDSKMDSKDGETK